MSLLEEPLTPHQSRTAKKCLVCERLPAVARNACMPCWKRFYKRGLVNRLPYMRWHPGALCSVAYCEKRAHARGMCRAHYDYERLKRKRMRRAETQP